MAFFYKLMSAQTKKWLATSDIVGRNQRLFVGIASRLNGGGVAVRGDGALAINLKAAAFVAVGGGVRRV